MSLVEVAISRAELDELKRLQVRRRWDWPAVFSANGHGEIWPFTTYGYTRGEDREEVRGLSSVVDTVADEYLRTRPGGGRFFISDRGAFYKDDGGDESQFLSFRFSS